MDIILSAITPIITTGIETKIVPIIKENLTKLDEIEGDINKRIDELTGKVKGEIDKIPVIPFVFTDEMKAELLAKLPFEKVDEALDKIDLKAIDNITIPSDADGKIKEKLTQFPEKIKSKLKSSIRAAFSTGASTTTGSPSAEAPVAEAPVAEVATPSVDKDLKITSDEANKILEDLKNTLGDNVFNSIIDAAVLLKSEAKPTTEAKQPETEAKQPETEAKQPETEAEQLKTEAKQPETDAEQPQTDAEQPTPTEAEQPTPTEATGGAKKRRRKTKKNIRRPKKSYTKFGRKF